MRTPQEAASLELNLTQTRATVLLDCSATTEKDAGFLADNNYRFTRELCEWCLQNGARFIYASSAATYGDGANGYIDDESATAILKPLNAYGRSKQIRQGREHSDSFTSLMARQRDCL